MSRSRQVVYAQWYDSVYFYRVLAEWPRLRLQFREHKDRRWRNAKESDNVAAAMDALLECCAADITEINNRRP